MSDDEGDEEKVCRYCFDDESAGELLSPCLCSGGQKWVHLACLRRWQRTVLVSQPTHPAFYDRDPRHYTCNVCKGEFTCAPPTRLELMASFTGPELGALVDAECIIGAGAAFSEELERQMEGMPPHVLASSSYECWVRGVYVITKVAPLDPNVSLPVSPASLPRVRAMLDDQLRLARRGKHLRLVAKGPLEGGDDDLPAAFDALVARRAELDEELQLVFAHDPPPDKGDDHVTAVNIGRVCESPPAAIQETVDEEVAKVCERFPAAKDVKVEVYLGGPCDAESLACCLVPGGSGCGWTVVESGLEDAVQLAHARATPRSEAQGPVCGGASVRLARLKARPELNGELGLALRFIPGSGRWEVRLCDGSGFKLKPANLELLDGARGRVLAFWGDAQWSRTQLLGELARGHWGLTRASVKEFILPPQERRGGLDGRLIFSPVTEMTEGFIREARAQMAVEMERNAMATPEGDGDDSD